MLAARGLTDPTGDPVPGPLESARARPAAPPQSSSLLQQASCLSLVRECLLKCLLVCQAAAGGGGLSTILDGPDLAMLLAYACDESATCLGESAEVDGRAREPIAACSQPKEAQALDVIRLSSQVLKLLVRARSAGVEPGCRHGSLESDLQRFLSSSLHLISRVLSISPPPPIGQDGAQDAAAADRRRFCMQQCLHRLSSLRRAPASRLLRADSAAVSHVETWPSVGNRDCTRQELLRLAGLMIQVQPDLAVPRPRFPLPGSGAATRGEGSSGTGMQRASPDAVDGQAGISW